MGIRLFSGTRVGEEGPPERSRIPEENVPYGDDSPSPSKHPWQ